MKYVYRYVNFESLKDHNLVLRNKYNFTDLADLLYLSYEVLKDGRSVEHGNLQLPNCAPGETCNVSIPYTTEVKNDGEYIITFSLRLKNDCSWVKRGYAVVEQQFKLNADAKASCVSVADPTFVQQQHRQLPAIAEKGKLKVKGNSVTGERFKISFADDGTIAEWLYDGKSLVESGTGPDFNGFRRIANDNISLGATGGVAENDNKEEGALTGSKNLVSAPKRVGKNVVAQTSVSNGKDTHNIQYTIYPDGRVDMRIAFNNSSTETRRVGVTMQFAPELENVEYYAKGPWSNYIDRQRGSLLVLHQRRWTVRLGVPGRQGQLDVDRRQGGHDSSDADDRRSREQGDAGDGVDRQLHRDDFDGAHEDLDLAARDLWQQSQHGIHITYQPGQGEALFVRHLRGRRADPLLQALSFGGWRDGRPQGPHHRYDSGRCCGSS